MSQANFSGFSAPQHAVSAVENPQLPLGGHRPIPLYSTQQIWCPNVLLNADALSMLAAQSDRSSTMFGAGKIASMFWMEEDTKEEREQQREAWLARQDRQLHHNYEKAAEKVVEIKPVLSPQVAPPQTLKLSSHPPAVQPPPQQVGMRLMGIPKRTRAKPHKFTESQLDFLRNVYRTMETPTIDESYKLGTQLGIEGDKIYSWFVRERQRIRREKGVEGKIRRRKDKGAASGSSSF